jgi:hypothetical protein
VKIKTTKYDKRFTELIRLRDNMTCQWCGKTYGKMDTSHIYSRRHRSIRHSPENACLKCFACHRKWHENPLLGHEWLLGVMGPENYDRLLVRARRVEKAPRKSDLDELYAHMADEIDRIGRIPAEERVHLQFRNMWKGAPKGP